MNPDFSDWCLRKREEREIPVERQGITQARRDRGRGWSDAASGQETPGVAKKLRVKEEGCPGVFREGTALLRPWLGTSSLQGAERISFRCFNQFDLTATCYHSPRNLEQCVLGWSIRNDRFRRLLWPTPTWRLHMVPPAVPWAREGEILVTRESFLGNRWWNWN